MAELLYREEVYALVGAAMEVYNQLGHGFLEAVYQEALLIECEERHIPVQDQVKLQIRYKQRPLEQKYFADFIAYDKIIIEIKAIKQLGPIEEAQLLNYLKATGLRLGVLINFGSPYHLQWRRLIL